MNSLPTYVAGAAVAAATGAAMVTMPVQPIGNQIVEFRLPVLPRLMVAGGQTFIEDVHELTAADFDVLTAADIEMLNVAMSIGSDDLDYSAFYVDDD
ncbi:hypothetical protein ASE12_15430 [Aeromicrobium sp. Root236]|nr:hypothetical protein ASE12_15430 [Aeromicrobium sp. Root236]